MNLFMIIWIAGHIGGVIGPLPYDSVECRSRAAEVMETLNPNIVTSDGYSAKDIKFKCEYHRKRPKIA